MSWTKAIVDSIQAGDEMKKTLGLIQGGVSSVTVRLQRVIDETDPADYPILLAVLSMSAKSFRQTLYLAFAEIDLGGDRVNVIKHR